MGVSPTLTQLLGKLDQLPNLCLVACNNDPLYTPRHLSEAPPPFPFLILLPQVINGVGGFPPLLILK